MDFKIIGTIRNVRVFAKGKSIRERKRLWKAYGRARWSKVRGTARIKISDGTTHEAEIHWYEAHGIGKKEFKIKRLLD